MNQNIVYQITLSKLNIDPKVQFDISFEKISNKILLNNVLSNNMSSNNMLDVNDIKTYNDKKKIILMMFVNNYIGLNPISQFNKYLHLTKCITMPIDISFRGFYVNLDLLQNLTFASEDKILQIGILPTFLEPICFCNSNLNLRCDFIQIKSKKPYIDNLYDKLMNDFIKKYPNICQINIDDFYAKSTDKILKYNLKKYNTVIFDTYKNIESEDIFTTNNKYDYDHNDHNHNNDHDYNDDNYHNDNKIRSIITYVHLKYVLFQIIIASNILISGGNLVILMGGFNTILHNQIIFILHMMFDNVILFNTKIDYSYRFYIIAKGFKSSNDTSRFLVNYKLPNINEPNQSLYLTNLLNITNWTNWTSWTNIITDNFYTKLYNKFKLIEEKINSIEIFFTNEKLIKKVYYDVFYQQLLNTNKFIKIACNKIPNDIILKKLQKYENNLKKNINHEYIKKSYKFNNQKSDYILTKINLINEIVSNEILNTMLNACNYVKLINLIILNDNIINLTDVDNKYQIDYIELIKILGKNEKIKIEFDIYDVCPLFLSIIYLYSIVYTKIKIIMSGHVKLIISFEKLQNTNFMEIKKKLLNHCLKFTVQTQFIRISENFLKWFDGILFKLIIKKLLILNKLKFIQMQKIEFY